MKLQAKKLNAGNGPVLFPTFPSKLREAAQVNWLTGLWLTIGDNLHDALSNHPRATLDSLHKPSRNPACSH